MQGALRPFLLLRRLVASVGSPLRVITHSSSLIQLLLMLIPTFPTVAARTTGRTKTISSVSTIKHLDISFTDILLGVYVFQRHSLEYLS
jgi:hypothetical protein